MGDDGWERFGGFWGLEWLVSFVSLLFNRLPARLKVINLLFRIWSC